MTEPERAALDHIRQVVDSVLGAPTSPVALPPEVLPSILPVPYVSQWDIVAGQFSNDSGAAAGTMLVEAYTGKTIPLTDFYQQTGQTADTPLSFAQISNALSAQGVLAEVRSNLKLADLLLILFSGRPVIAAVKQAVLQEAGLTPEAFDGPRYLVVVGVDVKQAFIHDSLRKNASGQAQGIPWLTFYQAWSQAQGYERTALIPRLQLVRRVRVTATALNVYQQPSASARLVGTVSLGDVFEITTLKGGWGKIGTDRWISLSYTADI
ncbi:MAG: SH3 domain-containing protein [Anaerolineales bacterium]